MIKYENRGAQRDDLAMALQDFNIDESMFIADRVLPVVNKRKKAANFAVLSAENNTTNTNRMSNGGELSMISSNVEDSSYSCVGYGLAHPVTDEDKDDYADSFDAEVAGALVLKQQMMNAKEIRIATEVFNTTTFATGNSNFTDYSSTPWSTVGTSIIGQVATVTTSLRTKCGFVPDTMIIGYAALQNLLKNTGIIARFPGAPIITPAMIEAELAALFGLQNLIVGKATYNNANEGQSYSGSDIWSGDYAMICKKADPTMVGPGLGWQFNWLGNGTINPGFSSYYSDPRRSTILQEIEYKDEVVYDTGRYGHLLQIEA